MTGDQAACLEGVELLGDGLTTVEVKRGTRRPERATSLPPARAASSIEAGAKQALGDLNAVEPYDPGKPCEIKVEYKWTDPVAKLRYRHGVELRRRPHDRLSRRRLVDGVEAVLLLSRP